MYDQRLPYVDGDDGTWGNLLNQWLTKEHVDSGSNNSGNGGHQHITLVASDGTAGHAPIKLTSGTLLLPTETGAIELNGDKYYMTITNGTQRLRVALYDESVGATGDVYYRKSDTTFTALPVSTNGYVLTLVSGLPAWQPTSYSNIPFNAVNGARSFAFFAG